MILFRRNFRRWWQVPRRVGDPHTDRRVSFLELFYDIVFVVLNARIAHALSENVSVAGVGTFVFIFLLVWWSWANGTNYHDWHGNNDVRTRVFTFLQMFAVAGMAIFVHDALGEGSVGFALSYAAFQLILNYLWWRAGVHDPDHRPLSIPYASGFFVGTLLFIISAFVPTPVRFYLWALAFLVFQLLPFSIIFLARYNPQARSQLKIISTFSPALVERFGLFTIIVLGEVVVSVVQGVAGLHQLNWLIAGLASLGMIIAIIMWWIYFDFISHRIPVPKPLKSFGWEYLHLPMTMGITAAGAGVLNVIAHSGEYLFVEVRWLLVGSVAIVLISISLLMRMLQIYRDYPKIYRRGQLFLLFSGIFMLIFGFIPVSSLALFIIIIVLMLIPAFYGIKTLTSVSRTDEI